MHSTAFEPRTAPRGHGTQCERVVADGTVPAEHGAHEAPSDTETALHGVQEAPDASGWVPLAHGKHVVPSAALTVPTPQVAQAVPSGRAYLPVGQREHCTASHDRVAPAGHGTHRAWVAASGTKPAAQPRHAASASPATLVELQGRHRWPEKSGTVPLPHWRHEGLPAVEMPPTQGWQASGLALGTGEYRPGAQASHRLPDDAT